MKPTLELPRSRKQRTSFVAFARAAPRFDFHWHYHPEYELTYIERSRGERLVGDHVERYREGDLVLLGPNLPHSWTSAVSAGGRRGAAGETHRAIVIQFSPAVLPPALRALEEFAAIDDLFRRAARGLHFRGAIVSALVPRLRALLRVDGFAAWMGLAEVLAELAAHRPARPLASLRFTPSLPLAPQARLRQALGYIDAHNEPDLSLEATARAAGVSRATLARLFRRWLGRSFIGYVNDTRLALVCRGLIESERGVAEIAFAAGFNNLANFNRCFRAAKKMSPTEFRRRYARLPPLA